MGIGWLDRLNEVGAVTALATLGAAVFAGTTALLIAFVAYPWQKRRDRELQVNLEKRTAYSRFFQASHDYYATMQLDDQEKRERSATDLRSAMNGMFFYATHELLHECKSIITLMIFRSALGNEKENQLQKHPEDKHAKRVNMLMNSFMDHERVGTALARSEILSIPFAQAVDEVTFWEDQVRMRSFELPDGDEDEAEDINPHSAP